MAKDKYLHLLEEELDAQGLKYEVKWLVVGIKVPIAFTEQQLAVFVDPCADGCGCPEHYLGIQEPREASPDVPSPFGPDPTRCQARIVREDHRLRDAGWRVLRFWEHDVDRDAEGVAEKVYAELQKTA
jgi:DNA mismatch endonuclease (patch repair protein)